MNNTSLYAPVYDENVRMVAVSFHDSMDGSIMHKRYTYKCAISVKKGDLVVCQARGWLQVCTIVDTDVTIPIEDDNTSFKWVITRIDKHASDTLIAWEKQLIEEINAKRVASLRRQLMEHIGVMPNELTTLMAYDDAVVVDDDGDETDDS